MSDQEKFRNWVMGQGHIEEKYRKAACVVIKKYHCSNKVELLAGLQEMKKEVLRKIATDSDDKRMAWNISLEKFKQTEILMAAELPEMPN